LKIDHFIKYNVAEKNMALLKTQTRLTSCWTML